jgi:hypothetical protein
VNDLADGYDGYYQERLWELLPGMYRALDSADPSVAGPLRELLNRIGIQVAVVRRSIDGLWADQFIETCADWVIPYLADLVATQLVAGLDARGQRLDVANTVHWRRRKGTVPTVDAVARDITGWGVHVLEAFRGLARTRHNLDPPVGTGAVPPGPGSEGWLPLDEGLIEPITRTPAGGFADLRSAPGALLSGGPFDQEFHHADLRRGAGAAGWYGIEKLVVYCWRLLSFEVTGATPVPVSGRAGEYAFDPTGREIPLFVPSLPDTGEITGTTLPWQVPGPLSPALARIMAGSGIPAVYQVTGGTPEDVRPESGRFRLGAPTGEAVTASYNYGFGGAVGAGPASLTSGAPLYVTGETLVPGGSDLGPALENAHAGDTVTITDSRTYTAVAPVAVVPPGSPAPPSAPAGPAGPLTVRARPGCRPVIRLAEQAPPWVFTGGEGAQLTLDGLFASGGDIVLRGSFDHVKIVGCTFDPGTLATVGAGAGAPGPATGRGRRTAPRGRRGVASMLAQSVDGRALAPTRVWIEAAPGPPAGQPDVVRCLEVDQSILGPIRTRSGGLAEQVVITDSIVQGFRTTAGPGFTAADVFDPVLLYRQLSPGRTLPGHQRPERNPLSAFIWRSIRGHIPDGVRGQLLARHPDPDRTALADALNLLLNRDIYRPKRFEGVALSPQVDRLLGRPGAARDWLNRLLFEDAYPLALAPAACAVADAAVHLTRVTVLGRVIAHRLHATDTILNGFAVADDTEDGCVRYSAALAGSRLPRQYNSVQLSRGAALFTSTAFGQPGYGQLLDTADKAIISPAPGVTLLAGSSCGAQMGAFPAQIVPVKEHALRVKYSEYLPLGLVPVIVHVT